MFAKSRIQKCPKIWIFKGSFYFRRGSETHWDTFSFETHRYAVKLDFSLVEKIEIVQHDPVWVSTSDGQIKIMSLWSLSSNIIQKSTKILQSRSKNRIPKSQDNIQPQIYIDISIFPKLFFFTNAPFHQGSVVRMGFFCNSSALGPSSNDSKWRSDPSHPNITSICIDDRYMIMIDYVLYIHTSIPNSGP